MEKLLCLIAYAKSLRKNNLAQFISAFACGFARLRAPAKHRRNAFAAKVGTALLTKSLRPKKKRCSYVAHGIPGGNPLENFYESSPKDWGEIVIASSNHRILFWDRWWSKNGWWRGRGWGWWSWYHDGKSWQIMANHGKSWQMLVRCWSNAWQMMMIHIFWLLTMANSWQISFPWRIPERRPHQPTPRWWSSSGSRFEAAQIWRRDLRRVLLVFWRVLNES